MANRETRKKFIDDVCRSIEKHEFDMNDWQKGDCDKMPTCRTALCKAGHIIAVRAKEARRLMKEDPETYGDLRYGPDHELLARRILVDELGEERANKVDFFNFLQTKKEALKELRSLKR